MKAKEKAKRLIDKFSNHCFDFEKHKEDNQYSAKQFALIAVDEIIESRKDDSRFDDSLFQITTHYITPHPMYLTYWLKVKEEIEKL